MKADKALEIMSEAQKLILNGKLSQAFELSSRAQLFLPQHFDAKFFHATTAAVLGHYDEALVAGLRALELNPQRADVAVLLSKIYRELSDKENLRKYAELAVQLKPDSTESAMVLAFEYYNSGDPVKAEEMLLVAYKNEPTNPEVVSFLAILWSYAGRVKEARELIERLNPDASFEVYYLDRYIDVLIACTDFITAEKIARIRLEKVEGAAYTSAFLAEAWADLGACLVSQDDVMGAKACYEKALACDPTSKVALINMAAYYRLIENQQEAIKYYKTAAELYPNDAQLYHHLNNLLREMGFLEQARRYGEIALSLRPSNTAYHANMAATLLAMGELKLGWQHYEVRLIEYRSVLDTLRLPTWQGEPAENKSLVLVREQGIGDELLFSTLFSEIIEKFSRVSIITHPKLMSLMARNFPDCKVYSSLDCPLEKIHDEHDFLLSIGSLPSILRNELSDFYQTPFVLNLDEVLQFDIRNAVEMLPAGVKIGIAWRSILRNLKRDVHYPELENWQSLFQIPGIQWINLQASIDDDELDFLHSQLGERFHQFTQIDHLNDLDASACLIDACDLVVVPCVSTSSIAGALNKPTIYLSYGTDHFMLGTSAYPWFPSLVPMPRQYNESWDEVFLRVAEILRGLVMPH